MRRDRSVTLRRLGESSPHIFVRSFLFRWLLFLTSELALSAFLAWGLFSSDRSSDAAMAFKIGIAFVDLRPLQLRVPIDQKRMTPQSGVAQCLDEQINQPRGRRRQPEPSDSIVMLSQWLLGLHTLV